MKPKKITAGLKEVYEKQVLAGIVKVLKAPTDDLFHP